MLPYAFCITPTPGSLLRSPLGLCHIPSQRWRSSRFTATGSCDPAGHRCMEPTLTGSSPQSGTPLHRAVGAVSHTASSWFSYVETTAWKTPQENPVIPLKSCWGTYSLINQTIILVSIFFFNKGIHKQANISPAVHWHFAFRIHWFFFYCNITNYNI